MSAVSKEIVEYLIRSLLLILPSGHFDVVNVEFSLLPPLNEAEGLKLQNWSLISSPHLLGLVV